MKTGNFQWPNIVFSNSNYTVEMMENISCVLWDNNILKKKHKLAGNMLKARFEPTAFKFTLAHWKKVKIFEGWKESDQNRISNLLNNKRFEILLTFSERRRSKGTTTQFRSEVRDMSIWQTQLNSTQNLLFTFIWCSSFSHDAQQMLDVSFRYFRDYL